MYSPCVGMLADAILVAVVVHVAVALRQVVQHNQVQVDLLLSIPKAKLSLQRSSIMIVQKSVS